MEPFDLSGVWWLPDNPKNQIAGNLKFSPEAGAHLELIGSFKNPADLRVLDNSVFSSPPIILGITLNGKLVTLYKCFEKSFGLSLPGLTKSIFIASFVFIGCHFQKEEAILFNEVSINYSNLDDWISISGISQQTEFDQGGRLAKMTLEYKPPTEISAGIQDFVIKLSFTLNVQSEIGKSINLKQTTLINIKPSKSLGLLSFMEGIFRNVRDFISLAIGQATHINAILGKSDSCITRLPGGEVIFNEIQIFLRTRGFNGHVSKIDSDEMLFMYRDISEKFDFYLKNWIDKAVLLEPVYQLYFGTFYNPSMYLTHEFLSLAQALETYHRRTLGGKYIPDEDYEPQYSDFIDVIKRDTCPDFRESLKAKMMYLNEYSLRRRLKDIIEKYGSCTSVYLRNVETFVLDVCNTRNYLTHYDEKLNPLAKSGHELFWLVQKMKTALEICLLSEMGMSADKITGLLSRNQKYADLSSK